MMMRRRLNREGLDFPREKRISWRRIPWEMNGCFSNEDGWRN
jgi:hypothetical protein